MNALIQKATRMDVQLRINYRSDDTPSVHITASKDTFELELCGPYAQFTEMCEKMSALLDVVDDALF
jgi:hypothetical protein